MKWSWRNGALGALAAIAAVWALASLWWPFQSDHGVYAWMADVVLHGGMLYRDAWDVKGPVAALPALIAQVAFGRNMWGIRVLDLAAVVAAAVTLYRVGSRWSSRAAALAAALIWVLAYATTRFNSTAQPDGFGAVLLLLATAPLLRPAPPRMWALAAAGAVVGVLVLLKPIYLAFLVIPVVAAAPWEPGARWQPGRLGAIVAGLLLPIILLLGWFALGHALSPFLDGYISYNVANNGPGIVKGFFSMLASGTLADPSWLLALACAVAGAAVLWPSQRRATAILVAWILAALLVIHIQRPYYPYRAHVLGAPLTLLALVASWRAWVQGAASRWLSLAVVAALAMVEARTPLAQAALWLREIPGPGTTADYQQHFAYLTTTAAGEMRTVRRVINLTRPGDHIFVFRFPSIYFLADRQAASRFAVEAAIGGTAPPGYLRADLDELHHALVSAPPALIIMPDPGTSPDACFGCFEPLTRMPKTVQALGPSYRLVSRADGFAIFAANGNAHSTPPAP
ncbi:MAG TPA: glycosyltransferase family 39 protein [Gemmatimonadales bacterium]|nr:glycosyltransferase family 39 protein [Gemmatimonadales bacterium]